MVYKVSFEFLLLGLLLLLNESYGQQTTAGINEETTVASSSQNENVPFIETYLIGPFKVWHVAGFVGCGIGAILIAICCMVNFRVPRTKEEIEANYEKRQAAHKYIDKLGQMEFTGLQLKSQALMLKERERKKKEMEGMKLQKKSEKQAKKNPTNANPANGGLGNGMPLAYHPGMMAGMMGGMMGYPNMMMGMPGMFGSTSSLQQQGGQGQPMTAGMPQGHPGMMHPNMWRTQSMSSLKIDGQQTPQMKRAWSSTSLHGTAEPEKATVDGNTNGEGLSKFKSLVTKLVEENKTDDNEEKKDDQTEDANKPKVHGKKKWGKK